MHTQIKWYFNKNEHSTVFVLSTTSCGYSSLESIYLCSFISFFLSLVFIIVVSLAQPYTIAFGVVTNIISFYSPLASNTKNGKISHVNYTFQSDWVVVRFGFFVVVVGSAQYFYCPFFSYDNLFLRKKWRLFFFRKWT